MRIWDNWPVILVRQGVRLLSDGRRSPVRVIGLDYDYWYEERRARGAIPAGTGPLPMGPTGFLYYVCFPEIGDSLVRFPRVDTEAFATAEEAVMEAGSLSRTLPPVIWDR